MKETLIAVLALLAAPFSSAEGLDDIRENKVFISEGICEYTDGQKALCTLWEDPSDPGYHYLAIYSNNRLIVIKRMLGMDFEGAENVWFAPELGI